MNRNLSELNALVIVLFIYGMPDKNFKEFSMYKENIAEVKIRRRISLWFGVNHFITISMDYFNGFRP